jgi:hypothetical protein
MEDYYDELYAAVNGMIEDGQPDEVICEELCDADPEILDDLIHEIRQQ